MVWLWNRFSRVKPSLAPEVLAQVCSLFGTGRRFASPAEAQEMLNSNSSAMCRAIDECWRFGFIR